MWGWKCKLSTLISGYSPLNLQKSLPDASDQSIPSVPAVHTPDRRIFFLVWANNATFERCKDFVYWFLYASLHEQSNNNRMSVLHSTEACGICILQSDCETNYFMKWLKKIFSHFAKWLRFSTCHFMKCLKYVVIPWNDCNIYKCTKLILPQVKLSQAN